jgi:hypothetical protein
MMTLLCSGELEELLDAGDTDKDGLLTITEFGWGRHREGFLDHAHAQSYNFPMSVFDSPRAMIGYQRQEVAGEAAGPGQ